MIDLIPANDTPLHRYKLDQNTLLKSGLTNDETSRLYKALLAHSQGLA